MSGSPRRGVLLATLVLAWIGACYLLRFGLMESRAIADDCLLDASTRACVLRAQIGHWIYLQYFGIAALALVLLAHATGGALRRAIAGVALLAAAAALVLYNVSLGAPAAVFALLTLSGIQRR